MEEKTAKIRINISAGEIEIEGTEAFVREYVDRFEELLEFLKKRPQVAPVPQKIALPEQAPAPAKTEMPEVFGEYLQRFPKSITDLDRILIAAYFVQSHEPDNFFTTRSANKLLTEQGIKVANASVCVRRNTEKGLVFALEKGKFRVSQRGIDYIRELMESELSEAS
jgi:hypothetical protein